MLACGGHCGNSRTGIVAGNGDNRNSTEAGETLNLFGEGANHFAGEYEAGKLVATQANGFEQLRLEVLGNRIEHVRSGSNGVFHHHLACEQIAEGIGDEENLVGSIESRASGEAQSIELEKGVEVQHLDAGHGIHLFAWHHIEEFLRHTHSVRVAVAIRIADNAAILAEHHEVDTPSVDTD